MKAEKALIREDWTIGKAIEYFGNHDIESVVVETATGQKTGIVYLENLLKAAKYNLHDYPINILIDYFEDFPKIKKAPPKKEIANKIKTILPDEVNKVIELIAVCADKKKTKAYLVGGLVRDVIRNKPNLDIDITIAGDGIDFAHCLANEYEEVKLAGIHPDFGTAKARFSFYPGLIDIASTRKEFYSHPGALPSIQEKGCSIGFDLFRRDFTVNAMAIIINKENYGEIVDSYGGLSDLENRNLRITHSLSFVDDPTRIIRGLKFALRFDYKFSPATDKLARAVVNSGLFDNFCTERLKLELKDALNNNNADMIKLIADYRVQRLLDKSIRLSETDIENFYQLNNKIEKFKNYVEPENIWLIYLAAMLKNIHEDRVQRTLDSLYMTNKEKEAVLGGIKLINNTKQDYETGKPSEVYMLYNCYHNESIIASVMGSESSKIIDNIEKYFTEYSKVKIYTTGNTLIELGLKPGEVFGRVLNELLLLKLDGLLATAEDEIEQIKKSLLH